MASQLSTTNSVKQHTRQFMSVASDKIKLASASVARGETRELDVAVIKATTSQFHVVPKEKHVRTLKEIVHSGSKDHVKEVIKELLHRLKAATDWLTALKCLMVIHRLMRECDTVFLNALLQYSNQATSNKGRVLNMGNFLDTTNIDGRFDFSEWVRGYGKYLDEQLEVYSQITFYPEQEHGGESSRLRTLSGDQLLKQLPILQRLQQRLVDCKPSGAAVHDPVVQAALMAVLKESFKVYKAISEGLINLADRFFEMEYLDAQKGLEIYKESIVDNARLQDYYREVEQIEELKRAIQFPKLENLPADFLDQMEGYVKEAPRPLEEASYVSKKKSPPLRRGTRAPAAPRLALTNGQATAGSPRDPGMISSFNKAAVGAKAEPPAAGEPDLLDLQDLSVADDVPPPAANGHVEFEQAEPAAAPAGASDPFGPSYSSAFQSAPSTSSVASDPFGGQQQGLPSITSAPQPTHQTGVNPFGGANGFQSASSNTGAYPSTAYSAPHSANANSAPPAASFPSGLPPAQPAPNPHAQRGGAPMAAPAQHGAFHPSGSGFQSAYSAGGAYSPTASFQPTGGFQSLGSFPHRPPSAFAGSNGPAYGGSQPGFGVPSPQPQPQSMRSAMTGPWSSTDSLSDRPLSPSPTPAASAGLTRPTNLALAKDAALHDPFAGLAGLTPSAVPKYSPPLKTLSPGSASTSSISPAQKPAYQAQPPVAQPNFAQAFLAPTNGFQAGDSAFGQPAKPQALTQPPQPASPQKFQAFEDADSSSLI